MKKKILSAILAVAICFSAFSFNVFADEGGQKDKDALQALVTAYSGATFEADLNNFAFDTVVNFKRARDLANFTLATTTSTDRDFTDSWYILQGAYELLDGCDKDCLKSELAKWKTVYESNNVDADGNGFYTTATYAPFLTAYVNAMVQVEITEDGGIITQLCAILRKAAADLKEMPGVTKAQFTALDTRVGNINLRRNSLTDNRRSIGCTLPTTAAGHANNGHTPGVLDCSHSWGIAWQAVQDSIVNYDVAKAAILGMSMNRTTNASIVDAYNAMDKAVARIENFRADDTGRHTADSLRALIALHHNNIVMRDNAGAGLTGSDQAVFTQSTAPHNGSGALAGLYARVLTDYATANGAAAFWLRARSGTSTMPALSTVGTENQAGYDKYVNLTIVYRKVDLSYVGVLGTGNYASLQSLKDASITMGGVNFATATLADFEIRTFVASNEVDLTRHVQINPLDYTTPASPSSLNFARLSGLYGDNVIAWEEAYIALNGAKDGWPGAFDFEKADGDWADKDEYQNFNLVGAVKTAQSTVAIKFPTAQDSWGYVYRELFYIIAPGGVGSDNRVTFAVLSARVADAAECGEHTFEFLTPFYNDVITARDAAIVQLRKFNDGGFTNTEIIRFDHERAFHAVFGPLDSAIKKFWEEYAKYPVTLKQILDEMYEWSDTNDEAIIAAITKLGGTIATFPILFFARGGLNETMRPLAVGTNMNDNARAVYRDYAALKALVEGKDTLLGDVNGDGEIDFLDAIEVLKFEAGLIDDINEDAADVNGDGEVNYEDAILILMFDAGLIDKF